MTLKLKIKKLESDARIPTQGYVGDAAFDLYASHAVVLSPNERAQIGTGLAMEIPEGYTAFIWDRSSMSHKYGLKSLGGVIDSGYRGEVKIGLVNLSDEARVIEKHHKIAQMVIQKNEAFTIVEEDTLSESERGTEGFGSTGK